MNSKEYVEYGYKLYSEFANNVKFILYKAIEEHNFNFELMHIQARAKKPDSLINKISKINIDPNNIEYGINDLAGCRIIFYTNNHVDEFINSKLIYECFSVVDYKRHSAVDVNDPKYEAIHYIVTLNDSRTSLSEYSKFAGLKCEIQIQTILNHAWSETTHDIIYKSQDFTRFGKNVFNFIKKQADRIMEEYLKPAGIQFQKIEHVYNKLLEGKTFIEEGELERLQFCKNNDERYELLNKLEFVIRFQNNIDIETTKICKELVDTVVAARNSKDAPIKTPFGYSTGKSYIDVLVIALRILTLLPHSEADRMFSVLCNLYIDLKNDPECEHILNAVENITRYKFTEKNEANLFVQSKICKQIAKMYESHVEKPIPVIVKALSTILEIEIEDLRVNGSTVNSHRKALPHSYELENLRVNAFNLFKTVYLLATTVEQRIDIFNNMWERIRFQQPAGWNSQLKLMIINDATRIINFFTNIVQSVDFEILQNIEYSVFWLYRDYHGSANSDIDENYFSEVVIKLLDHISTFRNMLNKDSEYVIYKTLIGNNSVFLIDWERVDIDLDIQNAYRKQQMKIYSESIQLENSGEWLNRLKHCASNTSNDPITFLDFRDFLEILGKKNPLIVIQWLYELDDNLERFVTSILIGLSKSDEKYKVKELLQNLINDNRYLSAIAKAQRKLDNPDINILFQIAERAIENRESEPLAEIVVIAIKNCTDKNLEEFQKLGLFCIEYCTKLNETRWVNIVSQYIDSSAFIDSLKNFQIKIILQNIEQLNALEYSAQILLEKIAENHPKLIVKLLIKRLLIEQESYESNYQAIPYKFRWFGKSIQKYPSFVLMQTRKQFDENNKLFRFEVGRLIRTIFPEFSGQLESQLFELINSGSDKNINFVIQILLTCKCDELPYSLIKKIISILNEDDIRLNEIENILMSTGVVKGPYGISEVYMKRKSEVETWLNDNDAKIRNFAKSFTRTLDQHIKSQYQFSKTLIEFNNLHNMK